jgi:hypothetical protein
MALSHLIWIRLEARMKMETSEGIIEAKQLSATAVCDLRSSILPVQRQREKSTGGSVVKAKEA